LGETRYGLGLAAAMLGKKRNQPLARTVAPAGDDHALKLALPVLGMGHPGVEHIHALGLALGGKGATLPAAKRDDRGARLLGMLERIERDGERKSKRLN